MLTTDMFTSLGEICIFHHLRRLELIEHMPETLVTKEKKLWLKEKMSAFKIRIEGEGLLKTLPDSYRETVRIVKERFYYFIYKFTSHKKR